MTTADTIDRDATVARIIAATRGADDETLFAVAWMLERDAAGKLDAGQYRSPSRGGGWRGYAVHDLTGAAVVASVNAITAVLSLLGRRPASKGMPVLESKPR